MFVCFTYPFLVFKAHQQPFFLPEKISGKIEVINLKLEYKLYKKQERNIILGLLLNYFIRTITTPFSSPQPMLLLGLITFHQNFQGFYKTSSCVLMSLFNPC